MWKVYAISYILNKSTQKAQISDKVAHYPHIAWIRCLESQHDDRDHPKMSNVTYRHSFKSENRKYDCFIFYRFHSNEPHQQQQHHYQDFSQQQFLAETTADCLFTVPLRVPASTEDGSSHSSSHSSSQSSSQHRPCAVKEEPKDFGYENKSKWLLFSSKCFPVVLWHFQHPNRELHWLRINMNDSRDKRWRLAC